MVTPFFAAIDAVLGPLGFVRRKTIWNRHLPEFTDVVELEANKAGDRVTVEIGVLRPTTHAIVWGSPAPSFVDAPICTARGRIGRLVGDRDLWWTIADWDAPAQVADLVENVAVPFFGRMHSTQALESYLVATGAPKERYPLPAINLAVLRLERGARDEACEVLMQLGEKNLGAWQARIDELATRIGCT